MCAESERASEQALCFTRSAKVYFSRYPTCCYKHGFFFSSVKLLSIKLSKCIPPSSDVLCFDTVSCDKCPLSINIVFPREMYWLLNVYLALINNKLFKKKKEWFVSLEEFYPSCFYLLWNKWSGCLPPTQTLASHSSCSSSCEHVFFSWLSPSST